MKGIIIGTLGLVGIVVSAWYGSMNGAWISTLITGLGLGVAIEQN